MYCTVPPYPHYCYEAHCIHTVRGAGTVLLASTRTADAPGEQLHSLPTVVGEPAATGDGKATQPALELEGVRAARHIFQMHHTCRAGPKFDTSYTNLVCVVLDPFCTTRCAANIPRASRHTNASCG